VAQTHAPDAEHLERSHEIGIDNLSKLPNDSVAIDLLLLQSDELRYCPSHRQVVRFGQALLDTCKELDGVMEAGDAQARYLFSPFA
jgi:hypothetical protein